VVEVDALISVVASLAEEPAWFKRLYDREAGLIKVVLRPGGQGEG
jgi:threonine dehydrogenase-like Zn-dependent dehydrogenase